MLSSQYFAIEIVDKNVPVRQEKLDLQQIATFPQLRLPALLLVKLLENMF